MRCSYSVIAVVELHGEYIYGMPNVGHMSALCFTVYGWVRACSVCYAARLWLGWAPQWRNGCCVAPGWRLAGILYHAKLNLSHIHIYYKYISIFAAISHVNAPWRWRVYAGYMLPSAMVVSSQNRSSVEYVLDSSTRGIKTYLTLKYCWCLTCFVTRVTRPCDFQGERVFRELDPREWR